MGKKLFTMIILVGVILLLSAHAFSQSTFIRKGRSAVGVGFGLSYAGLNDGMKNYSGSFGVSYSGLMDFGVSMAKSNDPTDDNLDFAVSLAIYPVRSESPQGSFSAGFIGAMQISQGTVIKGGGFQIAPKIQVSDELSMQIEWTGICYFHKNFEIGSVWAHSVSFPIILKLSNNSLLFIAPNYQTVQNISSTGFQVGIVWGTNILMSERDAWADS